MNKLITDHQNLMRPSSKKWQSPCTSKAKPNSLCDRFYQVNENYLPFAVNVILSSFAIIYFSSTPKTPCKSYSFQDHSNDLRPIRILVRGVPTRMQFLKFEVVS